MLRAPAAFHVLATLGLGTALVATPIPINFAALVIWAILLARWVTRRVRESGQRAGATELVIQLVTMSVLVLAAASAPVKVTDQVKAWHITLPRQSMTIGELEEPECSGLPRMFPSLIRIGAPDILASRVVRFPSRELTVGELIATVEAQTPLRHRFGHCGNGWTILWGGDCSFGLTFDVPPR
jgi:hypothetical protein